ncbi:MAG: GntR family transcriptional regulator [Campylobacter sp.]|nr:GntR family transcriptional regulator [Campylobacter sp.]
MIHLDYRDTRPIYTQIVEGFRQQILSQVLQPGDKLPSVRELAGSLTINPNTIQRAYRELEMQGWIATVPGKGCFVCGVPSESQNRQAQLLDTFDRTAAALLALGVTREELMARLAEGGNDHA